MTKGISDPVNSPADRTLITTRVFDAPREMVFKAWTDPKQFARWFPPDGFTAPVCELDVRPGGALRFHMKGGDGMGDFAGVVFPAEGVYREVVADERLAFTMKGENDIPPELLMTVIFEDEGRKTRLTIYQTTQTVAAYRALVKIGASEGLRQSLDKLAAQLAEQGPTPQ